MDMHLEIRPFQQERETEMSSDRLAQQKAIKEPR